MGKDRTHIDVPEMNLAVYLIERMKTYGNSIALIDPKTRAQYSYAEVIERIYQLASGLQNMGLRQGDVLCVLTYNTIEYPIIWFATNLLGGVFQTASPFYTDDELVRRFYVCGTKFLVTLPSLSKRITNLIYSMKLRNASLSKPNVLGKLIALGDAEGYIPYDSLFTYGKVTKATPIDPRTTASIVLSSSGTTGLPKMVQLSHCNLTVNMIQFQESMQSRAGETVLLPLPVFHHFGAIAGLGVNLYNGVRIVLMEKYDIHDFFQHLHDYRAQILQIVPAIAASLVKHPESWKYDLSSVRFIQTAAAPLGVGVEAKLRELFNLSYIAQAYGLTETGFNSGNDEKRYKPGSSGVSPTGVDIKIVDPDTGKTLVRNKLGEIVVGGPMITIGYLSNEQANKISFDDAGYFKTGDLGYIDADGFLFVVDRLKELIKYKGLQVAPAYLEDLLVKHEGVADVAVIGIPDEDAGELPKAFVVRQSGSTLTADEIIKYVTDQVSPHMRLRGGVEFIDEIPRNPSGKILRRFLRDRKQKNTLTIAGSKSKL